MLELAKAVEDGLVTGPRVVAAGRVITMTGGHCYFIGREADGVDAYFIGREADGVDAVRGRPVPN